MTPETEALIARVMGLDAKATKGPWSHYQITQDRGHFRYLQAESNAVGVINTWPNHEPLADADLIAHYRTAAPQLATALEAAEKRADAAEAKLKVAREALNEITHLEGDVDKVVCLDRIQWARNKAFFTLTQLEP